MEELSYSPRAQGDGLVIQIHKHQVQYLPIGALSITLDAD